jgi:hypothetical protein
MIGVLMGDNQNIESLDSAPHKIWQDVPVAGPGSSGIDQDTGASRS